MNQLWIFPTPSDATCTLRHDTGGWTITAVPGTHPTGRPGQVFDIPLGTPEDNGCQLDIVAPKYLPFVVRATLHVFPETYLRCDDFHLNKATTTLPRLVANGTFIARDLA